ncbi:MAG: GtrA family protein [Syntrophaceae bacterium]|nr:GtrA family protein [Syntrophaceae bacterium]
MIKRVQEGLVNSQLLKFLIVGISNAIVSYTVFLVVYKFVLFGNAFVSQCLSYAAGILWSFNWNKNWTFSRTKHQWDVFIPFVMVQVMLLFLSAFSLSIAHEHLHWNINIIWVCVMAVITLMNFSATKYLVFKA